MVRINEQMASAICVCMTVFYVNHIFTCNGVSAMYQHCPRWPANPFSYHEICTTKYLAQVSNGTSWKIQLNLYAITQYRSARITCPVNGCSPREEVNRNIILVRTESKHLSTTKKIYNSLWMWKRKQIHHQNFTITHATAYRSMHTMRTLLWLPVTLKDVISSNSVYSIGVSTQKRKAK